MDSNTDFERRGRGGTIFAAIVFSAVLIAAATGHLDFRSAPDAMAFAGRFHPLLVHLPIGFLIALFVLEILDLAKKSVRLHHATYYVAWLSAAGAVVSALLGVALSHSGQYGAALLDKHLWTGTATGVFSLWLVVLKMRADWREPSRFSPAYHGLLFLTVAAMSVAGHYGGALTHGSDYLTANMPERLRMVFGGQAARNATKLAPGQTPADLVAFDSAILPILQDKCANCHGPEKQEHKLRLDSYEAVMAGGKSGSNVVARSPSSSLMIRTLHLPKDDKLHMPPDGKPQLSPDDIALLTWWVEQGASGTAKFSDIKMSKTVARILHDRVKLPFAGGEDIPMQKLEQIAAAIQKVSAEIGVNIVPVSSKDAGLRLSYVIGGATLGDEEIARAAALKSNLVRLDLGGSTVTDTGLVHIAQFKNLVRLDLSRTAVTDAGITNLLALQKLEYLNLYGTKITDAALEPLKQLSSLRKIYLWQTAVTPDAVAGFQRAFMDEGQLADWKRQIAELQSKVAGMGVDANLGVAASTNAPAATNATAAAAGKVATTKPFNEKCCFTGKPVCPDFFSEYKGKVIGFCCEKCKARFDKDPAGEAKKIPPLASL